jgi:hypothetical protein
MLHICETTVALVSKHNIHDDDNLELKLPCQLRIKSLEQSQDFKASSQK